MTEAAVLYPTAAALIAAAVALVVGWRSSLAANKSADAALISARAAQMNAERAGVHRVAAFRQEWINTVIETLSNYHSIELTKMEVTATKAEDLRKMAALRTKLEILLNPNESDTAELLNEMDRLRLSTDSTAREGHDVEIVRIARILLKKEWARIKGETSIGLRDR